MTMAWIAVGTSVLSAGTAIAGANKQAKASKKASKQQMDQFNVLNAQQQPYIQSGYGALGKLNTLLGIGARPGVATGGAVSPIGTTPPVGMRAPPQVQMGPQTQSFGAPPGASNLPLRHILSMRAQQGDTEAQRVLQGMV